MTERALGSAGDYLHAPAWRFPPPANLLLPSLPTLKSWSSSSFQEECPALVLFRVPRTQLPRLASRCLELVFTHPTCRISGCSPTP